MSIYSNYADAVSNILLSTAAARGRAAELKGAVWGNAFGNLGAMAYDYPARQAQLREQQLREQLANFQMQVAQRQFQGQQMVNAIISRLAVPVSQSGKDLLPIGNQPAGVPAMPAAAPPPAQGSAALPGAPAGPSSVPSDEES